MVTLKKLLKDIYPGSIQGGLASRKISGITCDSRQVKRDTLFVALQGPDRNGAEFIPDAVKKGAAVIVRNNSTFNSIEETGVSVLTVADTRLFWSQLVDKFFDHPSQRVKTFGVTGTNGKTTITYLLESVLKAAGESCGVIGTVNYRLGNKIVTAKNTTPGLMDIQHHLRELAEQKIKYCAMEVSSHALDQGRVEGVDFAAAIFTNLTGDHLDYHGDMENYFLAKSRLFSGLSAKAWAVINLDDKYGSRLRSMTGARVITYAIDQPADVTAGDLELNLTGTYFILRTPVGEIAIHTRFIGRHNVYNILAVASACLSQKIPLATIKEGIEILSAVPGRLERIEAGQDFFVFVDYAHTEDALRNVLSSLRRVSPGRILLVFGCGGDRDRTKRPKMGRAAVELADWTIITVDNPRSEDPQEIVNEIITGCGNQNYEVILDRQNAIGKAFRSARPGDAVLIAGKGHEDYQILKNKTIHFDDREVARGLLKCLGSKIS